MPRLARLAAAVLFAFASGCAALADDAAMPNDPNPPVNPKVDVARGDQWTYELRDDISGELKLVVNLAVTDVADSEISARVRYTNVATNGEANAVQVFDRNWRQKDNGLTICRPACPGTGIPDNIAVGQTWAFSFESSKINAPATLMFAGEAKVASWERVTVANGLAFDAFKLVFDSAVTPVVNNQKVEQHDELWYAPAANRYVKRRYETRLNGKLVEATLETLRDYRRREK
jgi:hypothetical protein